MDQTQHKHEIADNALTTEKTDKTPCNSESYIFLLDGASS